ncbi:MAG: topoisomerase DNA-binding C4 zinc finger domain-containing protein, partial [Candidatus Bipolaricaulota bacterium]|nr:topoisomerase DNA-binding C4 zinc finger domain-containing protein [Candidatus Bipolaricaulota bacterium]
TDLLRRYFPETVEEGFTARMEEDLDRIQEGELERTELLRNFYRWFAPKLQTVEEALARRGKAFQALTDVSCPTCGAPMEVRVWRGSLYLGCSRYPECRTTRSLPPGVPYRYRPDRVELGEGLAALEAAPEAPCPSCGTPMRLRHGRYGRYLLCPSCGKTGPVRSGVPCPTCREGELVERSWKGRTFYSCSRYPDCTFRIGGRPLEVCPVCRAGVVYEDPRRGPTCSHPDCPGQEDRPAPARRPKRGTRSKKKSA